MKSSRLGRSAYWYAVAFVSGMSIMAAEIAAARIVAPYFGTSIFVWTNVIGIIMIALAIGYALGGRLADRSADIRPLLVALVVAAVLLLAVPLAVSPLSNVLIMGALAFGSAKLVLLLGSFVVILLLFALPAGLMAMSSPFVIRLAGRDTDRLGRVAGRVFAFSTLGSIVGTFLPTLALIPLVGARQTVVLAALALLVISLPGLFGRLSLVGLVLAPLPVLTAWLMPVRAADHPVFGHLLHDQETAYQYAQVYEQADGRRSLVYNEGFAHQSIYDPESPLLGTDLYFDYISVLPWRFEPGPLDVLVLGSAGGTVTHQLHELHGGQGTWDLGMTGVEIDPQIVELARAYFDLDDQPTEFVVQDARTYLMTADDDYDIIVVDAYSNQLYIPFHMATREFYELARKRLRQDGLLALNVVAWQRDSKVLGSIELTLDQVFGHVERFSVTEWNHLILASDQPIRPQDFAQALNDERLQRHASRLMSELVPAEPAPGSMVLTDDRAPLELLTDEQFFRYISGENTSAQRAQ